MGPARPAAPAGVAAAPGRRDAAGRPRTHLAGPAGRLASGHEGAMNMRTCKWLGLPLFVALAIGLSCAPIDPPSDGDGASAEGKADAVAYPIFANPEVDKIKPLQEVPKSLQKRIEAAVNNIR